MKLRSGKTTPALWTYRGQVRDKWYFRSTTRTLSKAQVKALCQCPCCELFHPDRACGVCDSTYCMLCMSFEDCNQCSAGFWRQRRTSL